MAKLLIERSNTRRFSAEELRGKVRESRKFWSSPEGKRREAQLEIERRNRKSTPPRFHGLSGTKPAVTDSRDYWQRRAAAVEARSPKL